MAEAFNFVCLQGCLPLAGAARSPALVPTGPGWILGLHGGRQMLCNGEQHFEALAAPGATPWPYPHGEGSCCREALAEIQGLC